MAAIFTAVDISGVAASVTTLGVGIIGIALVFKGIGLAKRAVSKA